MEKTLQPGAAAQLVGLPLTRTRDDDAKPFFKFRYAQFKKRLAWEVGYSKLRTGIVREARST